MGALDTLFRYGQPAATLLSGAAAEPLAGLAGLLSGNADNVGKVREAMTYQPSTEAGQGGLQDLGSVFNSLKKTFVDDNPPVRKMVDGYNSLSDAAGDLHPALGAAMKTLPTAAMMLAGPGSAATREAFGSVASDLKPVVGTALDNYMQDTGMQLNAVRKTDFSQTPFDGRYDVRVGEIPKLKSMTTTVDVPDIPAPSSVNLADHNGQAILTSMADRTGLGTLTHINEKALNNPVDLQAGNMFSFGPNAGGAWSSGLTPSEDLHHLAQHAAEATGHNPLFGGWLMSPSGSDFSSMTGNTMMAYADASMGASGKNAVDRLVKSVIPDWKGIRDPASQAQFSSAPNSVRSYLQNKMDKLFRNDGGLGIGQARLAISDPSLVNSPDGMVSHISQIDGDGALTQSHHVDYPAKVPGAPIGIIPNGGAHVYDLLHGQGYERTLADPRAPSTDDLRALMMKPYGALIDDNLLRRVGAR